MPATFACSTVPKAKIAKIKGQVEKNLSGAQASKLSNKIAQLQKGGPIGQLPIPPGGAKGMAKQLISAGIDEDTALAVLKKNFPNTNVKIQFKKALKLVSPVKKVSLAKTSIIKSKAAKKFTSSLTVKAQENVVKNLETSLAQFNDTVSKASRKLIKAGGPLEMQLFKLKQKFPNSNLAGLRNNLKINQKLIKAKEGLQFAKMGQIKSVGAVKKFPQLAPIPKVSPGQLPTTLPKGGAKGLAKQLLQAGTPEATTINLVKQAYPKISNPAIQVKKAKKLLGMTNSFSNTLTKKTSIGLTKTTAKNLTEAITGSKANRMLNKQWRGVQSQLSSSTLNAWEDYQNGLYGVINRVLRKTGTGKIVEKLTSKLKAIIKRLDDVFLHPSAVLSRSLTVYRGGWRFDNKAVGTIIVDKGFVSTTTTKRIARGFGKGGFLAQIHVPRGARGVWVKAVGGSFHSLEQELVFPRGSRFRILSMGPERTFPRIVNMELII